MNNVIEFKNGKISVPQKPIIPIIVGDGVGPDLWNAVKIVLDAAVEKAGGGKAIEWLEVLAGEKAKEITGEYLPKETLEALRKYKVSLKGPLATPIGGGLRSLNVAIRKQLDLYACVRPVKYIKGVPSPVKNPEKVNMVIFRENTEDVYAGLEWEAGSSEATELRKFVSEKFGAEMLENSAIGLKPMSEFCSKRLVRKAMEWTLNHKFPNLTFVHKGNIMKFTEGAFRNWGYEVCADEFASVTIKEYDVENETDKIVLKDRIADNMFMQILLRPSEYSVLAMPNLNGDYLSDALAAQIGGLGMAPGANIGDELAVFEATHGTAPKYTGQDKVNPCSMLLSGVLMLEYLGWQEAADLIHKALAKTISDKIMTYDLARQMENVKPVSCSGFALAIKERL